jgi:hypothetical protein
MDGRAALAMTGSLMDGRAALAMTEFMAFHEL